MHISFLPIVDAFEELQKKFLKDIGNTARMNTPLDQLDLIDRPPELPKSRWQNLPKPHTPSYSQR
jgi:hypothetical protein